MTITTKPCLRRHAPIALACLLAIGLSLAQRVEAKEIFVALLGNQEIPAVSTKASGSGTISINDDRTVSGSVRTYDMVGTKAHIHMATQGQNGPVIVDLVKAGETWTVPAGTVLTEAQYKRYLAGELYVNVHSEANPRGEVRAQLTP